MNRLIIEVDGLSKRYRLGRIGARTLREELEVLWHRMSRRKCDFPVFAEGAGNGQGAREGDFWALKDISFTVSQGEVLGIIGKNGAGKSTLLKILSRITEPTRGEAIIRGRVASLLEVGTGFHPELSGRENIFLNGAILGMTRAEIGRKFEEIVAFAEIERFIDTPVKRYSSGMYVRLAFAVAAHLEPEIMIVDEVLAVGDASFQKKCLGKMSDVSAAGGRTVLFVSHNMNAVETICDNCLLLDQGRAVEHSTEVHSVVRHYLLELDEGLLSSEWIYPGDGSLNSQWFLPQRFAVVTGNGRPVSGTVRNDSEIWVEIEGDVIRPDEGIQLGYGIFNEGGQLLFWSTNRDRTPEQWVELTKGRCKLRSRIPPRLLNQGSYRLDLFWGLYHRQWFCEPGVSSPGVRLQIQGGLSDSPYWIEPRPGCIAPEIDWETLNQRAGT